MSGFTKVMPKGLTLVGIAASEKINSMEAINHPPHYADGKIEVIDFIEDKNLNFNLGNVIKYVARAGKKDKSKELEDLKKALWYLQREINIKK